jgi:xanthine dehydrogenase YagR molybdenum-binding subunit
VVIAETEEQARAAARAVDVVTDALPAAIDPHDAMKDGAPLVWEPENRDAAPNAQEAPKPPESIAAWSGNVRRPGVVDHDADPGGRKAVDEQAIVSDLRFSTAVQMHATLERHGCVATWDGDTLTLHTGGQNLAMCAFDLALNMKLPRAKVRLVGEHTGGAFGSKASLKPEQIVAARMAMKHKRPVRIFLAFDEHLLVGGNRPGTEQRIRIGATKDGRLVAVDHEGASFCGVGVGERSTGLSAVHALWRHKTLVEKNVVTNTAPAMAFRAPGFPPSSSTLNQSLDDVAVRTRQHPLLLRVGADPNKTKHRVLRYALEKGPALPVGEVRTSSDGRFVRDVGVATAEWNVYTAPSCKVELRAHKDGHLEAKSAIHDMGQGARTVLMNVLVDELGLPPSSIHIFIGDSNLVAGAGAFGSMTTNSVMPAALHACAQLKAALMKGARTIHPDAQETPTAVLVKRKVVPWRELFATLEDDPLVVIGRRGDDNGGYRYTGELGALGDVMPASIGRDLLYSV